MIFDRKNIRLDGWDYSSEGMYFITICCKNRELGFGSINNNNVVFSEIGIIASQYWLEIPLHFPHVKIDEFVLMPNHIHGLLILDYSRVGPRHGVALQNQNTNKFSNPVKNSVSVIINQYKSSIKRWCNKNGFNKFCWQSRFYDKIIHNEGSLKEIRKYIINNPKNWTSDELYIR